MNDKIKYGVGAFIVVLFQTTLKAIGIVITGSLSFLSEAIDTFIDIGFVSILLYSMIQSQKPADYEHMYGHSKIDPIGALVQGLVLIMVYIILVFNAFQALIRRDFGVENPGFGLILLIISLLVNIIFSRFLMWKGKKQKSISLQIQGLNLFQDSLRAILVLVSFCFALFGIVFLDPIFSIILSLWIIYGAFKLSKKGIKELTDENPINSLLLEQLRENIFYLEHVNGIEDIRVRASGDKLYLEIRLAVEDHISVIHANEITKSIRSIAKELIPYYEIECLIEMNPLGGEKSISDNLTNLIYSIYTEYNQILNIKDVNIFSIEKDHFLSLVIVVDNTLTLNEAHEICTSFENEIKKQAPYLTRIISHIESSSILKIIKPKPLSCRPVDEDRMSEIRTAIEKILRIHGDIKGYHGLEFWTAVDYCVLEIHVFFDNDLNIADVHKSLTIIEEEIKTILKIENLKEVILHSEPIKGRTDGIFF
ncbi:MAG: cation diffusion facilitator family transporter [Candidatus Lokiarchaeota archaeon]|nr:cation diffusion facilitator family transporter [Candidatus Lokiarchaeota archaeon]